jgi:hypothetical protein
MKTCVVSDIEHVGVIELAVLSLVLSDPGAGLEAIDRANRASLSCGLAKAFSGDRLVTARSS